MAEKKDKESVRSRNKSVKVVNKSGGIGGIYFLAMIASAIYFVQHAHGFWPIVLALLKALVWPVFVTYRALVLMHV